MKKILITIFLALFTFVSFVSAQEAAKSAIELSPEETKVETDTVEIDFSLDSLILNRPINDYSMLGVSYGVTFSNTYFNPSLHNRLFITKPNYVSVTYTKYSKMFDALPYFGLVLGFAMGNEGYAFESNPITGYTNNVDGATYATMKVFEVPAMAQIHIDSDPIKIMANVGIYGGWRSSIYRSGPSLDLDYATKFRSYENRLDYGMQGGAGIALMLDPIEIHLNCLVRWSWSSLYQPDYYSKYYYRFAYPIDIMATVGIHYQLTKRKGRTRGEIRSAAYDAVYGKAENSER